jgi:putative spermidine/putrescine transport system permease protein
MSATFLLGPILVIVPMSFSTAVSFEFPPPSLWLGYYGAFFTDPNWLLAAQNSFLIALVVSALTMGLVVPVAFAYVRERFAGRALVNLLVMSPLLVPAVVSALGYYGFLGTLGLNGTVAGVALAHSALAIPMTFLVVSASVKGFDHTFERAAMISGAGPLRTFFYITLPILWPGMATGALFAFLASFNEAVVAIFIAGRDASTLPKKMFESIRLESDPVIAVVSTLLISAVATFMLLSVSLRARIRNAT